jgi:sec-independent protein translocase protein TatB
MDFLGVGPLELLVVMIIALIVVGPERLPQLAQSIGKTLRDLRALSQGLTAEWQREMSSMSNIDAGEGLQQALNKPLKEVQTDVQRALTAPLTSPFDTAAKPAPPKEPSPQEQPNTLDDDTDHADA